MKNTLIAVVVFIVTTIMVTTVIKTIDARLAEQASTLEVYTCVDIYYIDSYSPFRVSTESGRYDKIFNTPEERRLWLSEMTAKDCNQCKN